MVIDRPQSQAVRSHSPTVRRALCVFTIPIALDTEYLDTCPVLHATGQLIQKAMALHLLCAELELDRIGGIDWGIRTQIHLFVLPVVAIAPGAIGGDG